MGLNLTKGVFPSLFFFFFFFFSSFHLSRAFSRSARASAAIRSRTQRKSTRRKPGTRRSSALRPASGGPLPLTRGYDRGVALPHLICSKWKKKKQIHRAHHPLTLLLPVRPPARRPTFVVPAVPERLFPELSGQDPCAGSRCGRAGGRRPIDRDSSPQHLQLLPDALRHPVH